MKGSIKTQEEKDTQGEDSQRDYWGMTHSLPPFCSLAILLDSSISKLPPVVMRLCQCLDKFSVDIAVL